MALGWLWWHAWFPFDAVGAAAVCVAGVALGDIDRHFAWQAWHLATSIVTLRGRRGTYGTGLGWWRPWFPFGAVDAAAVCVAGVGLGDIDRHFAWQAWHLATSTVTLRGRRGTWRQIVTLRGRRGTYGTGLGLVGAWFPFGAVGAPAVCMAGVGLGDIDRHFAWQAWHLATSIVTLRGNRGTYGTGLGLVICVAGVALGDIGRHFAWQAWHLATSIVTLRGRRGTYGTGLGLVARLVLIWRRGRRRCLRGRRGTWRH